MFLIGPFKLVWVLWLVETKVGSGRTCDTNNHTLLHSFTRILPTLFKTVFVAECTLKKPPFCLHFFLRRLRWHCLRAIDTTRVRQQKTVLTNRLEVITSMCGIQYGCNTSKKNICSFQCWNVKEEKQEPKDDGKPFHHNCKTVTRINLHGVQE